MSERYEFDHVSIAIRDAHSGAAHLRRMLGATPLVGGVLPEFRYVLCHVGDESSGSRLELIAPSTPDTGFIHRFLSRHNETAHHLSFSVPDLVRTQRELKAEGFTTVQEELDYSRWQELFLPPDHLHGLVVQVAGSDHVFPPTTQLLASKDRDYETMPNNRGAEDPDWWARMWDIPVENDASLGATVLRSTNMSRTDVLFGGILHGHRIDVGESGACAYMWPTGNIIVEPANTPGVRLLLLSKSTVKSVHIGEVPLVRSEYLPFLEEPREHTNH